MPLPSLPNDPHPDLRQRAVAKLSAGARDAPSWRQPSEALAVLHTLASSPATAPDALALLHELQVHQVEVELQNEELRQSRGELEAALARHTALFDAAPVAYLTLDAGLRLRELNGAALQLLGAAADDWRGQPAGGFLSPQGAETLRAALADLPPDPASWSGALALNGGGEPARVMHAVARRDADAAGWLLVLVNVPAA